MAAVLAFSLLGVAAVVVSVVEVHRRRYSFQLWLAAGLVLPGFAARAGRLLVFAVAVWACAAVIAFNWWHGHRGERSS